MPEKPKRVVKKSTTEYPSGVVYKKDVKKKSGKTVSKASYYNFNDASGASTKIKTNPKKGTVKIKESSYSPVEPLTNPMDNTPSKSKVKYKIPKRK